MWFSAAVLIATVSCETMSSPKLIEIPVNTNGADNKDEKSSPPNWDLMKCPKNEADHQKDEKEPQVMICPSEPEPTVEFVEKLEEKKD